MTSKQAREFIKKWNVENCIKTSKLTPAQIKEEATKRGWRPTKAPREPREEKQREEKTRETPPLPKTKAPRGYFSEGVFYPYPTEKAPKAPQEQTPWVKHVKAIRQKNPSMSWKEALQEGSRTWTGGKPEEKKKKKKDKYDDMTKEELQQARKQLFEDMKVFNKVINDTEARAIDARRAADKKKKVLDEIKVVSEKIKSM